MQTEGHTLGIGTNEQNGNTQFSMTVLSNILLMKRTSLMNGGQSVVRELWLGSEYGANMERDRNRCNRDGFTYNVANNSCSIK